MDNIEFIEKNLRELSRKKIRIVCYAGTLLWTFEDSNKSTKTFTQKEFGHYLRLCLEHNDKQGKKLRRRAKY